MTETGLIEVSRVSSLPLSLLEAKRHLRIIGNDADDLYLRDLLESAELILEYKTMRPLRYKVYTQTFPAFQTTQRNMQNLYLYRNPVVEVQSFTMLDINNVSQTVTNSQLRKSLLPATLSPLAGQFWPLSKYRTMESISVTYKAGYAAGACDPRLKLAMRYLISHMYENREAIIVTPGVIPNELPYSLTSLVRSLQYGGFV